MNRVIVLHAPLPGHAPDRDESPLLDALPYARRLELARRNPASRTASLAGITLALECATRLRVAGARAGDLCFPQEGKPYFSGGPYFSISHTSGRVACAASAVVDCGLDVEALPCGAEPGDSAVMRLRRWTATEAVLKAAGRGLRHAGQVALASDLRSAILLGHSYELLEVSLAPGMIAHVAAPERIAEISLEEVPAARVEPVP